MSIFILTDNQKALWPKSLAATISHELTQKVSLVNINTALNEQISYEDLSVLVVLLEEEKIQEPQFDVLNKLRYVFPNTRVICIKNSGFSLKETKRISVAGIKALFSSYSPYSELVDYLLEPKTDKLYLCSVMKESLLAHFLYDDTANEMKEEMFHFSTTEKNILACVKKGLSMKETAEQMGLSVNTVAAYRSRMIKKTGARSFFHILSVVDGKLEDAC